MASNKYFNLFHQQQEQNLVQDLVQEAIKIHAIDVIYIPRTNEKIDPIFRENPLSFFNDFYHVEAYIKNVDGFEGDADVFRKFGLEIKNQITFTLSRKTFSQVFGRNMTRPREGDLIYLPMSIGSALYEIKFVKGDSVFFNLGEFYTYDLQCEQYAFEEENFSTGIAEVDEAGDLGNQTFSLDIGNAVGTFAPNEIVYQGESIYSATARANFVEYLSPTKIRVKNLFQVFSTEQGLIKGATSEAQATIVEEFATSAITNDFGASNKEFVFLDFTESNPFSEE